MNDPYDFNAPMSALSTSELAEIHEDPAFQAWVDGVPCEEPEVIVFQEAA